VIVRLVRVWHMRNLSLVGESVGRLAHVSPGGVDSGVVIDAMWKTTVRNNNVYPWFSGGAHLENLSDAVTHSYHVPTLVIQGTADTTVPYADGPILAKLTHGQLWRVTGVGHDQALAADTIGYITRVIAFIQSAVASPG
jgi:pimeloyl-ACP methyl ester carboxylesterase